MTWEMSGEMTWEMSGEMPGEMPNDKRVRIAPAPWRTRGVSDQGSNLQIRHRPAMVLPDRRAARGGRTRGRSRRLREQLEPRVRSPETQAIAGGQQKLHLIRSRNQIGRASCRE